MAENSEDQKKSLDKEEGKEGSAVTDSENIPKKSAQDALDLDDDLADALGESGEESTPEVSVDELIGEADPEFSKELEEIASADFSHVVIEKNSAADEVDETTKVPSMFRAYFDNLSKERKNRYLVALVLILVMVPVAVLIFMGKLLPSFDLPYYLSMNELTQKVHVYDLGESEIPLFDSFRNNTVTSPLPKTVINLRSDDFEPSYGEFEFFLVLRDKEVEKVVQQNQAEILDLVQRVLEQISWEELKNPMGKERVKKILRHQLNEHFQGSYVVGVYYRSVLLQK